MVSLVDFPRVDGAYDRLQFDALVEQRRQLLSAYRSGLDMQIDYGKRQDHTFAELLYLSFEAPSLQRLAREWNLPEQRAAELLRGKPVHSHPEFKFLGEQLYRREDVEALAPYGVLAAPHSIREPSAHEPSLIGVGS
jgi:hypothetical protein